MNFFVMQQDVYGFDFARVLGLNGKNLIRNAIGFRPRTFNGMFEKLMRESGLALNGAEQMRTLYSLRHTYATVDLFVGTDIHTLSKQMDNSAAMIERH